MKKIGALALSFLLMVTPVAAVEGEIGYFGGTSVGVKLPTIAQLSTGVTSKLTKQKLAYNEIVYLSGEAIPVTGTIEFTPPKIDKTKGQGKYTESYVVRAESADGETRVTRQISFDTQYYYEESRRQMTKISEIKKWSENVVVKGNTYRVNQSKSNFSKSILEDYTPGVMYYRGDVSYDAVYEDISGGNGNYVTMSVSGPIYGYEQTYGKTETQKRSISIDNGKNQYYIEEMPTLTVYRDIQYGTNDPFAISFDGNYKEILRSEGSITYDILQGSLALYDDELKGSIGIRGNESIEQLSTVNLPASMNGHPAESDVKKMYSMKIFTRPVTSFSPNQIVTRGEYVKMLVNALKLELPSEKKSSSTNKDAETVKVFTDLSESSEYYPYAMAAYNAGLVAGGSFSANTPLTREVMYIFNMRLVGLQRLGAIPVGGTTAFVDDAQISAGAKSAIYAASKLGLTTTVNGYVFPKKQVSYAECAAFLGQLIDYLRYDLQKDYSAYILN